MKNKIMDLLTALIIVLGFYLTVGALVYSLMHPELTEMQVFLHMIGFK